MPASAFSAAVQSLPSATNIKTMHRVITEMRLELELSADALL
jgi:hypothetical protein